MGASRAEQAAEKIDDLIGEIAPQLTLEEYADFLGDLASRVEFRACAVTEDRERAAKEGA